MSDVTESDVNAGAAEKKGGNKKLLVIGGAAVALLLVVGGGGFFLMSSGMLGGGEAAASAHGEEGAHGEAATAAHFFDLPEITVKLNTGTAAPQYLKLAVSLEIGDETMLELIEPRMPRVLDAFQVYLRELRPADLEGSAGLYRLKEELQRRVNLAVYPASVENILFKEILIQ